MNVKNYKYIVDEESIETRLDRYMQSEFPNSSRSQLQKDIKASKILVNDKKVKTGYLLKENDVITYEKETVDPDKDLEPIDLGIEVIYEDDDIMLINKPKNLVVHPATSYKGTTLVNGLLHLSENLSDENGTNRPGIVHRLDKDTAGLMVIAKNNKAHIELAKDFKNRDVIKHYYAIVRGTFDESTGTINMPIKRDEVNRLKMAASHGGRNAVTHFRVVEEYLRHSLLDVEIETGRTHQIRVHLSKINHPVLSDPLYGPKKPYDDYGQYLFAYKLIFNHPIKKEQMTFELPLPSKFLETIKNLA